MNKLIFSIGLTCMLMTACGDGTPPTISNNQQLVEPSPAVDGLVGIWEVGVEVTYSNCDQIGEGLMLDYNVTVSEETCSLDENYPDSEEYDVDYSTSCVVSSNEFWATLDYSYADDSCAYSYERVLNVEYDEANDSFSGDITYNVTVESGCSIDLEDNTCTIIGHVITVADITNSQVANVAESVSDDTIEEVDADEGTDEGTESPDEVESRVDFSAGHIFFREDTTADREGSSFTSSSSTSFPTGTSSTTATPSGSTSSTTASPSSTFPSGSSSTASPATSSGSSTSSAPTFSPTSSTTATFAGSTEHPTATVPDFTTSAEVMDTTVMR